MRTLIVAVVSTPGQAGDEKASIPLQLERGLQACEARGWEVVAQITIPGHSRNYLWLHEIIRECPEYGRMVALIEAEAIDLVVCHDYDRLWRTDALRAQLQALCEQHRVQIYSVNQPTEVRDPADLVVTDSSRISQILYGVIAEQENRSRVRRWRAGMLGRAQRGLSNCRGFRPYGYAPQGPSEPLAVVPAEARWVRWMFERRARGWGYDRIAHELRTIGVPSPRGGLWYGPSVLHILGNPLYKGTAKWGAVTNANGQWEPIVSVDLWERANAVPRGSRQLHVHTLSGLGRCGYCGYAMVYGSNAKPQYSLRCNLYAKSRGERCRANYHSARRVEAYVLAYVREVLSDPERYLAVLDKQRETVDTDALRANAERLSRARSKWDHEYERDEISRAEWQAHRARIAEQLAGIERVLREEDLAAARRDAAREHAASLSDVLGHMDELSRPEQNELLRLIVARVELRREEEPRIYLL